MSHGAPAEASAAPSDSASPGSRRWARGVGGKASHGSSGKDGPGHIRRLRGTRLLDLNPPKACFHWSANRTTA